MARDVSLDRSRALLEIHLSGLINGESLRWGITKIDSTCRSESVDCVVWDLRSADLSQLDFAAIQGTVQDWPAVALKERARIAVVAGSPQDEILLQLWREAGRQRDNWERQVFLDIEKARDWAAERQDRT